MQEATLFIREGESNDKFRSHPKGQWSKRAFQILHNPAFKIFDLSLTIFLMLLAFLEKPTALNLNEHDENPLILSVSDY